MASQIPPIEIKLIADVQELKAGLQKAEQQIETLKNGTNQASAGMEKFQSGVNKAALALTAAAAAAGFFAYKMGKEMVEAAMADEKAQTLLANRLRNVVGASDEAIASTEEFINKLQMASGVSDSKLRPALSQLVGVTKNLESGQKLLKVAMDLSAGSGVELETATKALTRAAQGNYGGLQRMGVVIDETTKKSKDFTGVLATLQEQFGGAAAAQADTFAGRLQIMQTAFDEMKESIGFALLPALTELFGYINAKIIPILTTWIEKNKEGLIKGFKNAVTQAVAFFNVMFDLFQFVARNIKVFATLGAVIVAAIFGAKVAAAVSAFVGAVNAIIKVMKTLRTVSLATAAANALATGGISAAAGAAAFAAALIGINVAMNKFNDANDKASGSMENLDETFKGLDISADDYKVTLDGVTSSTDKAATAQENSIKKLRETMKKTYAEIDKLQAETADKRLAAEEAYQDKALGLLERYNEAKVDIETKYQESLKDAQESFDAAKADAQKRRDTTETAARKRHTDNLIRIAADYAEREAEIKADLNTRLADLEADYQKSQTELRLSAENKRLSIVQQSMDRLRSAFAARTGFDLAESFKTNKSAEALLTDLKNKLDAAQKLQKNAAVLAGMGYSQTFIEQVVKEGPEAGNAIAEALKAASPQATKELQSLYAQVETVSETGLDSLAQTLNAGGNLATRELRAAYAQVAIDLQADLKKLNADLLAATAEAIADYNAAIAKAKADRDKASAESFAALTEALDEAKAAYDEAIAEAEAALDKARLKAEEERTKQLAAAKAAYDKAIADAQKALEKSINDIQVNMLKKLAELRAEIAKTAAEMSKLGGKPYVPTGGVQSDFSIYAAGKTTEQLQAGAQNRANKVVGDTNIVVNGFDLSDPNATAQSLVSIAKYGQTITVLSSDTAPIVKTGLSAARAGIVRVAE